MKLALGTVQFGLPYGISNQGGKVVREDVKGILALSRASGIDTLDTAIAYQTLQILYNDKVVQKCHYHRRSSSDNSTIGKIAR